MSYVSKIADRFSRNLKHDLELSIVNPMSSDIELEGYQAMNSVIEQELAKIRDTRPDCLPNRCDKQEKLDFYKDEIAGKSLDEIIALVPNIQYTTSQITDFIYKEELVIKSLQGVKHEQYSANLTKQLDKSDITGQTNKDIIKTATKHALLYGRAGLFKKPNGLLDLFEHDYYTVVIGYKSDTSQVKKEVLGYILYNEAQQDAVLDLSRLPANYDITWFQNYINSKKSVYDSSLRMRYVPARSKQFVNLRYDLEKQNPLSRLYFERQRMENSIFLHEALNRKFKERGIGRLIVQMNTDDTSLPKEQNVTELINNNKNAKSNMLDRVKEFARNLANTFAHLDDDDVLMLPKNMTAGDRLENTNEPDKFLDVLDQDENFIPAVYGIPATLLGLGTLSDRNISIQAVNQTSEDTTIANIRQIFVSQLSILFNNRDGFIISTDPQLSDEQKSELNKTISETALNLFKAGLLDEAKQYVTSNLIV